MRRKLIITSLLLVAILSIGVVALGLLLRHEPAFYSRAEIPPGHTRTKASKICSQKLATMLADIFGQQDRWQAAFTELQLNSYFAEDFVNSRMAEQMLPEGISDLRIAVQEDILRLGFRYGTPAWSTVVSLDVRIWMVRDEANVVAMQFLSLRAGAIPVSPKTLMKHLAKLLERPGGEQNKIDIDWYRHEGKPVALLRFTSNSRNRPTTQLRLLKVENQSITIAGLSVEPSPVFINKNTPSKTPVQKSEKAPPEKTKPEQVKSKNTKPSREKQAKLKSPKKELGPEQRPKKESEKEVVAKKAAVEPPPVGEIPPPAPTISGPRLGPIIPIEPGKKQ